MSILEAKDVRKYFGGIKAVDGFSMEVEENKIFGLIGPNGAGKTTFFNVAAGIYPLDGGEILFQGERLDGLSPNKICLKGLTRTFQITRELGEMTLWENMLLPPKHQRGEVPFWALFGYTIVPRQEKRNWERAEATLKAMGLYELRNEYAKNLSAGQRKMLEAARALMTGPELLLLDEPTAGATLEETKKIMGELERLRDEEKLTLLIVEHKMEVIMNICETIYVMHHGKNLAKGDAETVQNDERVIDVYLGE